MNKEKLNKIVESVYKATTSGSMKWSLFNSVFNSDTRHKFEAISSDGITKFYCEVSLSNDLKLDNSPAMLRILNPGMVDDGVYLHSPDYPTIKLIQNWIYINHVQTGLKIVNQDNVMDDILRGIDVSEYRDKKIETILGENSIKHEEEKKSLLKKLFGK